MTLYTEISLGDYDPPEECEELWNRIIEQDKIVDFEYYIDDTYANGLISETELDDLLRYESAELEEILDLEPEDDDYDEDEDEDAEDDDAEERGY